MTDNRLGEIKQIQKQIVQALETGQDVKQLRDKLARVRAEIVALVEDEELKKIADQRQALKDKAKAVKVKVQKQGEAIDRFLSLRDALVSQLQPLIEPMRELARMAAAAWERDPGECYIFNDLGQFVGEVNQVRAGYLPPEFGCPFLEMKGGLVDARGKASEAYSYFMSALGILAGLQKGISTFPLRPAEGLMSIDDEPESEVGSCIVCSSPEVEAINNLLRQGKSLRDIEAEFGISRSSLSRHKNNCLNLGAIRVRRVEPESPAASANQTYFK
jgi:hypothetical protein